MIGIFVWTLAYVDTVRDVCEPAGYYYGSWLGVFGPDEGTGLAAGGSSGGWDYRGYLYWSFGSQLDNCSVTAVSLRLVTNNSGSGCYINVNKVAPYGPPSWDDCADEAYATNVATPSGSDQEFIIPLNQQAVLDLQAAINGSKTFGVGTSEGPSATGQHYFWGHWALAPDDAWLIVECGSVYQDNQESKAQENKPAVLYDAAGRPVRDYGAVGPGFKPDLKGLSAGVYILKIGEKTLKFTKFSR